jgi:putative FmdB family regulatory protein
MPTYTYKCPVHGEFDTEHSVQIKLETCPKCEEEKLVPQKVTRLIAGGTTFTLVGGGWAKDLYK